MPFAELTGQADQAGQAGQAGQREAGPQHCLREAPLMDVFQPAPLGTTQTAYYHVQTIQCSQRGTR